MQVSLTELASHNKHTDMWIAIHMKVYDITKYAHKPSLAPYAGRNVSLEFDEFHQMGDIDVKPIGDLILTECEMKSQTEKLIANDLYIVVKKLIDEEVKDPTVKFLAKEALQKLRNTVFEKIDSQCPKPAPVDETPSWFPWFGRWY
jgi:cytochrome b involved in lipid metabolism